MAPSRSPLSSSALPRLKCASGSFDCNPLDAEPPATKQKTSKRFISLTAHLDLRHRSPHGPILRGQHGGDYTPTSSQSFVTQRVDSKPLSRSLVRKVGNSDKWLPRVQLSDMPVSRTGGLPRLISPAEVAR